MNLRKVIFAVAFVFPLLSASAQMTGNDSDAHGCRASAGYTYSKIKKECVRPFELELQLDEVNPQGSSTFAAVIFTADSKKAELFVPRTDKGSIILVRKGKSDLWSKAGYELARSGNSYSLKQNGKLIYDRK